MGGRRPRPGEIPLEQSSVVGANIRVLRQRKGWSQGMLGEQMGWPSTATANFAARICAASCLPPIPQQHAAFRSYGLFFCKLLRAVAVGAVVTWRRNPMGDCLATMGALLVGSSSNLPVACTCHSELLPNRLAGDLGHYFRFRSMLLIRLKKAGRPTALSNVNWSRRVFDSPADSTACRASVVSGTMTGRAGLRCRSSPSILSLLARSLPEPIPAYRWPRF